MAILFNGKYPSLYESLKDEKMVIENQASITSSVEEIDSEFAGIIVMLDELLSGSFVFKHNKIFKITM